MTVLQKTALFQIIIIYSTDMCNLLVEAALLRASSKRYLLLFLGVLHDIRGE